jgi:hypothetical protein
MVISPSSPYGFPVRLPVRPVMAADAPGTEPVARSRHPPAAACGNPRHRSQKAILQKPAQAQRVKHPVRLSTIPVTLLTDDPVADQPP